METMWTPWRIGFIVGEKPQGCFLCEKHRASPQHDKDNYILHRGSRSYVLLNLYPYTNGHLMVAPYEHVGEIEELDGETLLEMGRLVQASVAALKSSLSPHGFNIGLNLGKGAGAGVEGHLHLHVVPRWQGDTNFMSVLADTRLIPEALDSTYERLLKALAAGLLGSG